MASGRTDESGRPLYDDYPFILSRDVADRPQTLPAPEQSDADPTPPRALAAIRRVMAYGAVKHGAHSYHAIRDVRRIYWRKVLRHLVEYACGKRVDDETGESPLAHAAADAMILLEVD